MPRTKLTDAQWELVEPLLPGKEGDPGRTGQNNRRTLEGILWVLRTGAPWRDLPEEFGKWISVYQRFRRWSMSGVFARIFEATKGALDLRAVQVDGSFVKVHQHGTGAPRPSPHGRPWEFPEAGARPSSWPWWTAGVGWCASRSTPATQPRAPPCLN